MNTLEHYPASSGKLSHLPPSHIIEHLLTFSSTLPWQALTFSNARINALRQALTSPSRIFLYFSSFFLFVEDGAESHPQKRNDTRYSPTVTRCPKATHVSQTCINTGFFRLFFLREDGTFSHTHIEKDTRCHPLHKGACVCKFP